MKDWSSIEFKGFKFKLKERRQYVCWRKNCITSVHCLLFSCVNRNGPIKVRNTYGMEKQKDIVSAVSVVDDTDRALQTTCVLLQIICSFELIYFFSFSKIVSFIIFINIYIFCFPWIAGNLIWKTLIGLTWRGRPALIWMSTLLRLGWHGGKHQHMYHLLSPVPLIPTTMPVTWLLNSAG